MQVIINGDSHEVPEGITVASLLEHLQVRAERVAVERNRLVVRRASFGDTALAPGDVIEILTFVGGG